MYSFYVYDLVQGKYIRIARVLSKGLADLLGAQMKAIYFNQELYFEKGGGRSTYTKAQGDYKLRKFGG